MGTTLNEQPFLFEMEASSDVQDDRKANRTGTFTDNMKLPIHRWFRYSAGFSAEWVEKVLKELNLDKNSLLLDPFAGSATAMISAAKVGIRSYGLETHPFVRRIGQAKLNWNIDEKTFLKHVNETISRAKGLEPKTIFRENSLLKKCYTDEILKCLESLRLAYLSLSSTESSEWKLVWLAITSILRECSGVGTAQWQYVLPNKEKKRVMEPYFALLNKAMTMASDINYAKRSGFSNEHELLDDDAREIKSIKEKSIDCVITSPPYPNNYDYADATRLEMTFWHEIDSWGDLHGAVRKHLVRSCSQHTSKDKLELDKILKEPILDPIREEITEVCQELSNIRLEKGGRKTYHTMIAAYFVDMGKTWKILRKVCKEEAKICFVIGDSAPYGVYTPVEKWFEILALSAGFRNCTFEKIRDRNIKWKNRKHRVPLKEGNLWVEG